MSFNRFIGRALGIKPKRPPRPSLPMARGRGWGSAFQPSNVPGAQRLQATNSATGGSTMPTADSPALVEARRRGLFRGVGKGELAKGLAAFAARKLATRAVKIAVRSAAQGWRRGPLLDAQKAVAGTYAASRGGRRGGKAGIIPRMAHTAQVGAKAGLRYARRNPKAAAMATGKAIRDHAQEHRGSYALTAGFALGDRFGDSPRQRDEQLGKRTPGTPLSEAELEQRRAAARSKMRERMPAERSTMTTFGGAMGAAVGFGIGAVATNALNPIDRRLKTRAAGHQAETEGALKVLSRHAAVLRSSKSRSRAVVPYDTAAAVVPKHIASAQDRLAAGVKGVERTGRLQRLNSRVALAVMGASALAGGLLGARSAGRGVDRMHAEMEAELDAQWDRRAAEERAKRDGLGKRAGDGHLSEAEHAQRVAAARASAEKRRGAGGGPEAGSREPRALPGGPSPQPKKSSLFSQYRADPDDKEWKGRGDDAPAPRSGPFVRSVQKPQVPKELGEEKYVELARWAAGRTRDMRPDVLTRAAAKGLIPGEGRRANEAKPDPKTVRVAYNLARNLALHDVGVFEFDWNLTPEAQEQLRPLVPFMRYARRVQGNALREEKAGEWAPFRREFGKPFKDGRTYAKDTRGQKAGEEKKAFARHLHFLKAIGAGDLAKSLAEVGDPALA
jgi:hypothetical protein